MPEQFPAVTHHEVQVNGIRLHCVEAGPDSGPLVVLLHGFPEFWYGWRHQLLPLARAGFRVVAPDLRGYNTSEKPPGVLSYRLDLLVRDVLELVRQYGHEKAHVVGHDWGGMIAWKFAMQHPATLDRLVILNAPHPAAYQRELARNARQVLKSWYVGLIQIPWASDTLMRRGIPWIGAVLRATSARPEGFTDHDVDEYERAWRQPGAVTASLNYYRALRHTGFGGLERIDSPTLLLWGMRDVGLVPELTCGLEDWVQDLTVVRFDHASHWITSDDPVRVNNLLISFLQSGS